MPGNQWWRKTMKQHGNCLTASRKAIIEVLNSSDGHLNAEEIYMHLHEAGQKIGLTTVYRTLNLLIDMGLAYRFNYGDQHARYELIHEASDEEHHHHLICTACGKITNYYDFMDKEKTFLKNVENGLSKKYSFTITDHVINFYGMCENCINA